MPTAKPRRWPADVTYIRSQRYHSSVPAIVRSHVEGIEPVTTLALRLPTNGSPPVTIQRISSLSHPAYGQYGLFASQKIHPRTHIIDYIGEVHCDDRPDSDYDLSLYRSQDGVNVGVDARTMGNEARFINDFRGIRDKPNAVFADGRRPSGELRMSVWTAGEAIKKGDEILVSYGKSWWQSRSSE
jgi:SET domain-containing protein